jgi:hypothetical protein
MAALRDMTEVIGADRSHELKSGRNRVVAYRELWLCHELSALTVDAIAQAIQRSDLMGIEPQAITARRIYQEEGVSWYAENGVLGWFLLLWAAETRALTDLWPSIHSQANLMLAQRRLDCAIRQLGATVSGLRA